MEVNNKVIKKIIILIFVLAVFAGCSNKADTIEVETSAVSEAKDDYTLTWGVRNQFLGSWVSEDGKAYCTIQDGTGDLSKSPVLSYMLTIPVKYAVEVNLEMESKKVKDINSGISYMERRMKKFDINVYGLKSGESENTIDVLTILRRKDMNIMPTDYTMLTTRMYEDKPCLVFEAEDIVPSNEDKNNNTKRMIYIDVETGELFEKEYEDISGDLEDENRINSIFTEKSGRLIWKNLGTRNQNDYDVNTVSKLNFWEGCRQIHFAEIGNISEDNEKIFEMFPDLKEIYDRLKKSDMNMSVDIVLTGNPREEDIMELILPEGRELSFEGITISGEDSIDGEEHDIHSFDEWREYCKPAENPGKYASPIIEVAD